MDAIKGRLLSEYKKGARNPSVFIIWEVQYGTLTRLGMVCIHTSREYAERRVASMNSSSFWKGTDRERSVVYRIEECEVDHLFASEMLGYDLEESRQYEQMVRSELWFPVGAEGRYENLRVRAAARIAELEAEATRLKEALDANTG